MFAQYGSKPTLLIENFKVIVNDEESEIGSTKYRVQQSTILGSVMFIFLHANSAVYDELLLCIIFFLC